MPTAKVERLEKELKTAKANEKAKDKEVDDAWKKMSDFEKMVMELRDSTAAKVHTCSCAQVCNTVRVSIG